jgi:hypothetical protein
VLKLRQHRYSGDRHPVGQGDRGRRPGDQCASAGCREQRALGKWRGQYSGAYQGHFVLRWHQSGSKLNGTITLSTPTRGTVPIHGTVQGSTIKFGTVGSEAITYSGSASGSSMSGTWQIKGHSGAAGGGPWSASRS